MALSFFLRLLLGHMVGDFFLQPYWLVLAKRKGWVGLIIHVGVVTLITAVLLWASIPKWWVWVIVLYLGHLFIDQFRTFVFTDNRKGKGLLLLILDQITHILLIVLIAWLATGWTMSDLRPLASNEANQGRLMVYLIGLAIIISVAPVLEAETTVATWAMTGTEVTHTVEINFSDRLLGGIERLVGVIVMLTSFWWLIPLLFIPRLVYMIRQGEFATDKVAVITKVATSFVTTLFVGFILAYIPLPVMTL